MCGQSKNCSQKCAASTLGFLSQILYCSIACLVLLQLFDRPKDFAWVCMSCSASCWFHWNSLSLVARFLFPLVQSHTTCVHRTYSAAHWFHCFYLLFTRLIGPRLLLCGNTPPHGDFFMHQSYHRFHYSGFLFVKPTVQPKSKWSPSSHTRSTIAVSPYSLSPNVIKSNYVTFSLLYSLVIRFVPLRIRNSSASLLQWLMVRATIAKDDQDPK